MIRKCLLLVALTMFVAVSARVPREAPQKEVEIPQSFSEFFETAGKSFTELEKTVLKAFGVDNREELEKKALEQGKEYATKLDSWAVDVKKEASSLSNNEVVKDLSNTIDKVIENWKQQQPETAEDIKKYMQGGQDIINKIKNLGDTQEAKNIKDLSAKLLEKTTTTFTELAKQIHAEVIDKESPK